MVDVIEADAVCSEMDRIHAAFQVAKIVIDDVDFEDWGGETQNAAVTAYAVYEFTPADPAHVDGVRGGAYVTLYALWPVAASHEALHDQINVGRHNRRLIGQKLMRFAEWIENAILRTVED